jgi:hypothetical protein
LLPTVAHPWTLAAGPLQDERPELALCFYVIRAAWKASFPATLITQKPDDFRHPAFQLAESEGLGYYFAVFLPPFICA